MDGTPLPPAALRRSESSRLASFATLIAERRLSGAVTEDPLADIARLERDLELCAEVGKALLESQRELKDKLTAADSARDVLLDRLAASYRDNAQLERVRRHLIVSA